MRIERDVISASGGIIIAKLAIPHFLDGDLAGVTPNSFKGGKMETNLGAAILHHFVI